MSSSFDGVEQNRPLESILSNFHHTGILYLANNATSHCRAAWASFVPEPAFAIAPAFPISPVALPIDYISQARGILYGLARLLGDISAVQKGTVGKRIGRRVTGKATGRLLGKLFK